MVHLCFACLLNYFGRRLKRCKPNHVPKGGYAPGVLIFGQIFKSKSSNPFAVQVRAGSSHSIFTEPCCIVY